MKFKLVLLSIIVTFFSCSKDCNHDAEDRLAQWFENEPEDYAYSVSKSAFISAPYVGPYRFEVRDNQIDTIYFDLENSNFELEDLFEGWDDFEQVKEFSTGFEIANLFENIIANSGNRCEVEYDGEHFYPSHFRIKSDPDISDSGVTIRVFNFQTLE